MLHKVTLCYCTERFFRSGDTEKQVINGCYEGGKFSFGFYLGEYVATLLFGSDD